MSRRPKYLEQESETIYYKPRNKAQIEAFDVYQANDITFFLGVAGTSKTFTAIYCSLYDKLSKIKQRKLDKIVIVRPVVTSGEELGYLPGNLQEKVHPYMIPIYNAVGKMLYNSEKFIEDNFIVSPLAYQRGLTFENCTSILDEAQNCSSSQLKLFLSRLGIGGKMIVAGDTDQADIKNSALESVVASLEGIPGIGVYRFTDADIVRHPLVGKILKRWPA